MRRIAALLAVVAVGSAAMAAVLYDNWQGYSPPYGLVNYPGQGFGGYDASAIQTTLNENVYGYGHALSAGYRVADDFVVPTDATWTITGFRFFAYQTGAGTGASTMNHVNIRIWQGVPGAGGTIVWGDTSTNRLTSSNWSQIYRSIDTALTATNRPIFTNECLLAPSDYVTLGPGSYWVDWQTGGTGTSGPWAPPISILNMTGPPGANARQWNGTAWYPIVDSINLTPDDMPFQILPEPASLLLLGLGMLLRRR